MSVELQKQIEYYLGDKNLEQDEFFHGKIKEAKEVHCALHSGIHRHRLALELQQNQKNANQVC